MNFVNAYQSHEERRTKYNTCQDAGIAVAHARRIRDLTWPHFALALDAYTQVAKEQQEQDNKK